MEEGLPDDVRKDLAAMVETASNLTPSLDQALSSAQKSYGALQDFEDAMSSGSLSSSLISSVGALGESLNDLVAGYYADVVSSDELYNALSDHYENDLTNYANALIAKNLYYRKQNRLPIIGWTAQKAVPFMGIKSMIPI